MSFRPHLLALLSTLAIAFTGACKDKAETPAKAPVTTAAIIDAAPAPAEAPQKVTSDDYFRVNVWHTVPKPEDPVVVSFPAVKTVKAAFDPTNLEGASATLELDIGALVTGNKKRDSHLKDSDFFDVELFPRASIAITEVKKHADDTYKAKAEVSVHGEVAIWAVEFKVVATTDSSVTIEATHKFDRNEFKVGAADTKSHAGPVEAQLRLTLEPTP